MTKNHNELFYLLGEVTSRILFKIREEGAKSLLDYSTRESYHGFERISVNRGHLMRWISPIGDKPWEGADKMSVEVITVYDQSADVHFHTNICAVLTILGDRDGFHEPRGCHYVYRRSDMKHAAFSGITLEVAPRMLHGFGSPVGCDPLSFLSVQSQKVTDEDFHIVGTK